MMAAAGFPQWNIKGVYPELRFRRTIAHSNAVYYRYRQNEWLLGLNIGFDQSGDKKCRLKGRFLSDGICP